VITFRGAPAAGAEIELRPSSKEWPDARALAPRTARTEADGRFALDKLAEIDWSISIAVPESVVYRNELGLRSRQAVTGWNLELKPGLTREGTVLDAAGKPAAGVRVVDSWGKQRQSDRAGKFSVRHLQPNESFWLRAQAPSGAVATGWLEVSSEQPLVLRLHPPSDPQVLRLRVVDPAGKPVAGALVMVNGNATFESGVSDADGRFFVISAAPTLHVTVIQKPFQQAWSDLAFPHRGVVTIALKLP